MTLLLLGIGLVLVIEGLALALAPLHLENLLRAVAAMGRDRRRTIGLAAVAIGAVLIWVARSIGL